MKETASKKNLVRAPERDRRETTEGQMPDFRDQFDRPRTRRSRKREER